MGEDERYYEMLWDCEVCKTAGLLAKSQRHCPMCGAGQDPARRYFPEPGQEVEVRGHRFVGADWRCAYCASPNATAAAHCVNCGAAKEGASPVATVSDPRAVPPPPVPDRKGGRLGRWLVGGLVLVIGGLAAMFYSTEDVSVEVRERTWAREIRIERLSAVSESAWCDSIPADAYALTRTREVRSQRQVAAGQECREKRVDQGDGTFSKQQECQTKYRDEPVYDERCHFRVNRWQTVRSVRADSQSAVAPVWPALGRLQPGGSSLGAEREGARVERYTLGLAAGERRWTCEVPAPVWAKYREGSSLTIKVRKIGGADCGGL